MYTQYTTTCNKTRYNYWLPYKLDQYDCVCEDINLPSHLYINLPITDLPSPAIYQTHVIKDYINRS